MILAFGVLTAQVGDIGYADTTFEPGVRVPIVMPGSAAQRYGLQAGDMILALDGDTIAPGAASPRLSLEISSCLQRSLVMLSDSVTPFCHYHRCGASCSLCHAHGALSKSQQLRAVRRAIGRRKHMHSSEHDVAYGSRAVRCNDVECACTLQGQARCRRWSRR